MDTEKLSLKMKKAIKDMETKEKIWVFYDYFGYRKEPRVEEIEALTFSLKKNIVVKELSLIQCQITDDGAVAIAQALYENTTITSLILSDNKIGDAGAAAIAKAYSENAKSKVSDLALAYNRIGDAGAGALAACLLKRGGTLKRLFLGSNMIQNAGACEIASAISQKYAIQDLDAIQVIDLSLNRIEAEGLLALARALETNTSLERLGLGNDFDNDNILDLTIKHAFIKALQVNTTLILPLFNRRNEIDPGFGFSKAIETLIDDNRLVWLAKRRWRRPIVSLLLLLDKRYSLLQQSQSLIKEEKKESLRIEYTVGALRDVFHRFLINDFLWK